MSTSQNRIGRGPNMLIGFCARAFKTSAPIIGTSMRPKTSLWRSITLVDVSSPTRSLVGLG